MLLLAYPFGKTPGVAKKVEDPTSKFIIDANNYYPGKDGPQSGQEMQEKGLVESERTVSCFPGALSSNEGDLKFTLAKTQGLQITT